MVPPPDCRVVAGAVAKVAVVRSVPPLKLRAPVGGTEIAVVRDLQRTGIDPGPTAKGIGARSGRACRSPFLVNAPLPVMTPP